MKYNIMFLLGIIVYAVLVVIFIYFCVWDFENPSSNLNGLKVSAVCAFSALFLSGMMGNNL